jgi:hypothetical protein
VKSINYSLCYLFKGQSYIAKQKLTKLKEKIQDNASIIQTLDNFTKTSQVAEIKDVPSLESLITEVFIRR